MTINNFEYFIFLFVCLSGPLGLVVFHPGLELRKYIKPAILAITIAAIPFIIWDVVATYIQHWSFNSDFITGIYLYNLPLEEVLFFFVIPWCCLTIWAEIRTFTSWGEFWGRLTFKDQNWLKKI